jgi:alkylation response protein AidB-like acyl-CoA dehydrogenase
MREEVLAGFKAIAPEILAHRQWAEEHCRLADGSVRALLDAGIARLYLPESLGGLEADPLTCAAVTELLARHDPAAAWFTMVANSAKLMAAQWSDALVETVLGENPDVVVAASGNRPFIAERKADGFMINGVNSFVSGCHHAQWLLSPVVVDSEIRTLLMPMADCEIVDNWHALGMRGTGSNDVRAVDVWVPASQVVAMPEPGEGSRNSYYQGALYRCPGRIIFATYVPVTLALAERALDELALLAEDKTPYAQDSKLKHRSLAQLKYGKALAVYRAGRGYFLDALKVAWERADSGLEASPKDKADLYLAGTHAVQSSAEVVRLVADAAGSSVIYEGNPLESIVRDMETLRHHGFANESRYGSVAQLLWGATLDYPLLLR